MKHELHPEVARMERNAALLLYALAGFAAVLFAALIALELKQWPLTPIKPSALSGTTSPSAAEWKARAFSYKQPAGNAARTTN